MLTPLRYWLNTKSREEKSENSIKTFYLNFLLQENSEAIDVIGNFEENKYNLLVSEFNQKQINCLLDVFKVHGNYYIRTFEFIFSSKIEKYEQLLMQNISEYIFDFNDIYNENIYELLSNKNYRQMVLEHISKETILFNLHFSENGNPILLGINEKNNSEHI